MRWAFALYAKAEVRWTQADAEVFHTVIGCTAGYSKVWEWVTLRVLAELSRHDRRTCQLSLHRLDEHNVISWQPGDGREWSRVALPTEGGRLAWTSEGRSHATAPRSPAGDTKAVSRPAGATAPRASRGGDIRPPQGRSHATAPLREGFSRSESTYEKEGESRTFSPSVEDESPTEQPGAPSDVSAGPEGNPGTDAAEAERRWWSSWPVCWATSGRSASA